LFYFKPEQPNWKMRQRFEFGCVFTSTNREMETCGCFHDNFVSHKQSGMKDLPTLAKYVAFNMFELERICFCTSVLETDARRPMCAFLESIERC